MNIKVPVSWLKEYLKTDVAAKTIASSLTLSGPSVEKIVKQDSDYLFDVEVTVNRPDAFSIYGIAREAHAILKSQGLKSTLSVPKGLNLNLEPDTSESLALDVNIKTKSLCPRFTAIVVDNVKVKPSPKYIQSRLEKVGIRAINNVVDISNYLMLELGQPMHTFDYDKIKKSKMILRESVKGEHLKTLDGVVRQLPEGTIVIEDGERLIDLCGIMGGANSAVTNRTRRVVIFVQAYNPQKIRKTTQTLAFRTDASTRFEKGIDLEGVLLALSRAVYLAKQTAGARIASELIDIYVQKPAIKKIYLETNKINNYLGVLLNPTISVNILDSLGFKVLSHNESRIVATIPSWRTSDIQDDVDLIEEIARVFGYHNLPSKLPAGQIPRSTNSNLEEIIYLKNALKILGLTEVMSYSIISADLLNLSKIVKSQIVELANPLTEQWQYLRPSIIPSLLEIITNNSSLQPELKIFEIARIYKGQKKELPSQDLALTIATTDSNFYQVKGLIENVSAIMRRKFRFYRAEQNIYLDRNQSASVNLNGEQVGVVGTLNNKLANHFSLKTSVSVAEINLTKVYSVPKSQSNFKPIPKYPPIIEDLSVIVAQTLTIEELIDEIKKENLLLLKVIEVIDIFEDPKLGENKKSVTLRFTFQKPSGTLTMEEANEVKSQISQRLENKFRAKIRK